MASRRHVDDSEEEEATAIDLRSSKSQASRAPPPGSAPQAPAKKPPLLKKAATIVDDDDDEDATEFLSVRPRPLPQQPMPAAAPTTMPPTQPQRSQPSSSSGSPEPQMRARGRAVPLGESPQSPPSQSSEASMPMPPAPASQSSRPARESTEPLLDVEALNNMPRAPRPLPNVTSTGAANPITERARHPAIDEQSTTGSHAGTSSVPRITRIHVVESATSDSTGPHNAIDPETTLPPSSNEARRAAAVAQQVLAEKNASEKKPDPARIRSAKAATAVQHLDDETQAPDHAESTQAASTQPSSTGEIKSPRPVPSTADGEGVDAEVAHDGVLVVEAPNDAVVVVNGVDRGKGVVRVGDLDRRAKHAVRIHAPGFQPWSGSVTLEGKPAAKIRPTLKPRAR